MKRRHKRSTMLILNMETKHPRRQPRYRFKRQWRQGKAMLERHLKQSKKNNPSF